MPHAWLQKLTILTGVMSCADANKVSPASDSVAKVAHGENLLRYWLRPIKRLGVDAGARSLVLNTVMQRLLETVCTCHQWNDRHERSSARIWPFVQPSNV